MPPNLPLVDKICPYPVSLFHIVLVFKYFFLFSIVNCEKHMNVIYECIIMMAI